MSDTIAGIYAARAGGTAAEWRETVRAERWYSASEAVAAGLADRVLDPATVAAANLTGRISAALTPGRRPPRQPARPDGSGGHLAAQLREGLRAGPDRAVAGAVLAAAGGPARRPAGRRSAPSVLPLVAGDEGGPPVTGREVGPDEPCPTCGREDGVFGVRLQAPTGYNLPTDAVYGV